MILPTGLALFAFGVFSVSPLPFFASAAVLGAGHGLAYLGSLELTDAIAPRDQRAEVFSGFQLGLYGGATVPASPPARSASRRPSWCSSAPSPPSRSAA